MEQSNRILSLSPSRLTDRRGRPELQPLERPSSLKSMNSTHRRIYPQSSISSLGSANSAATTLNTSDVMSIPATPTEPHWYQLRMFNGDYNFYETNCDDWGEYRGLGSNVEDRARQAAAIQLSKKLQAASEESTSSQFRSRLHTNFSGTERTFRMPLTPPPHGEILCGIAGKQQCADLNPSSVSEEFDDELYFLEQDPDGLLLDEGAFCSEPLTPVSPSLQTPYTRNRRVGLLDKVLPQRFRENIKRRMSGQTNHAHSSPIINTPIPRSRPRTPSPAQSDWPHCFGLLPGQEIASSRGPPPDPQFILPISTASPRQREHVYSPLQSPRTQSLSVITDFPEVFEQVIQNEIVRSPLQPPSVSPVTSPRISVPLTSLNMLPPLRLEEQTIPTIDPTSTVPCRKVSGSIDVMSNDTISQLMAEMGQDAEAYTFVIQRMMNHGWSSEDEIRNLEVQRNECLKKWQRKIAGARRVLDGLSKCGLSTPFQFPERSVKSMDSIRSENSRVSSTTSYILAGPGASITRSYSQ